MTLADFRRSLDRPDLLNYLQNGLIGAGMPVPGPDGPHPLVYADYTASGRALRMVEDFVLNEVLPSYANTHTDASYCGGATSRLRTESREFIRRCVNADDDYAVIFCGSGATAAINKFVSLAGLRQTGPSGLAPVVFLGPYEHHSNILPWRESAAIVIEIPEGAEGGPDLGALDRALCEYAGHPLKIGAFSAASNVTGLMTDTDAVTRLLKRHDALAVWDYAGAGPYLPIDVTPDDDTQKDAIFISPHKFVGGPAASGVLVVRKGAVTAARPTEPGGGTVRYVSPWRHDYVESLEAREEAGTPNIIGDIRAGLAFAVKDAFGAQWIGQRDAQLAARGLAALGDAPGIELLGPKDRPRLPIFSFLVRDVAGAPVHHQLFTRLLSDRYGIQARGGCACAGPYGHRLLGISREVSEAIYRQVEGGYELAKPGWVRLNLSYVMTDEEADFVLASVIELAASCAEHGAHYRADAASARFRPIEHEATGS